MNQINRQNRKGGGVASYVSNSLDFKIANKMSTHVNDIMECITVELCINKSKNIIVSCVYRTPGSDIQSFNDKIEMIIKKVNSTKKSIFVCGDLNIDLLNYIGGLQ